MKKLILISLILIGCSKQDTSMLRFQFAYWFDSCERNVGRVDIETDRGLFSFDAHEISGGVQTSFKQLENGPYTITSVRVFNKNSELTHIVRENYNEPETVMTVPFKINLTEDQTISGGIFCR